MVKPVEAKIGTWQWAAYDVLQVSYDNGDTFLDMDTIRTASEAGKAASIVKAGRVLGALGYISGTFRIRAGHRSKQSGTYFYR